MLRPIDFSGVADIYDIYVRTDFDIPFWLKEARAISGRVLELTSGTGRVSIPLLESGIDLTCVDHCPEMLDILRQKVDSAGLTCNIVEMDISELALPIQYDLIFIPFNSFSEILGREKQMNALFRIRSHLAEDGVFICTLRNPDAEAARPDGKPQVLGPYNFPGGGELTVTCKFRLHAETGIVDGRQLYEFRDLQGKHLGKRVVRIAYHLLSESEFEEMISEAGFEIVSLYGDYDCSKFQREKSPYMIWKLKASQR